MASAAAVIAQAVPHLQNAFPRWKAPIHMRAQFVVLAAGAQTMVAAETTPGLVVTETATDGEYTLTFPPCRRVAEFVGNVSPLTPTAAASHRHVKFETANAAKAATGTITFRTLAANGGAIAAPADGGTVEISFWADLG